MAVFSGYYDTGGAEDQGRVLVTVGVVATVEEWNVFDRQWLDVLRKYDISSFHMVDIAHWKGDIASWPLKDGKRDEGRRIELLRELVQVGRGIQQAFVRGVLLADYAAVDACYPLSEQVGSPYSMAQAICLLQSIEQLREKDDPIIKFGALVEHGDRGQDKFRAFCERYLSVTPHFVGKKNEFGEDVTPLSLADLIAYEHHLLYTKADKTQQPISKADWRGLFRALRGSLPLDARVVEARYLEWLCAELKLPRREDTERHQ